MQNKPVNNHCSIKGVQVRHRLGLGCLTCSGRLARGVGDEPKEGSKERLGLGSCQREFVRGSGAGAVYVLSL